MDKELVEAFEGFLNLHSEQLQSIKGDLKILVKISLLLFTLCKDEGLVDIRYNDSWEFEVTDKGEKFFKEVVSFFIKEK